MTSIKPQVKLYPKMKLYIKQKVMTLGERFTVKNEYEEDLYIVEGSFLSIPKRFTIYDMKGNPLSTVKRRHVTMFPGFTISTPNETITLKQKFALARMKFAIESLDWSLRGNFTAHEYEVTRGSNPIMTLTKHWFTWGDSYELDIEDERDALLCLSIVIAIDYALYLAQSSN